MQLEPDDAPLTDLAEGVLAGAEWDDWLAAHPDEAAQVEIARRVRAFMTELQAMEVRVPADFERRLLARVHEDMTLLDLLDLGFGGLGYALIEFLNTLFAALPAPPLMPSEEASS
jgi:hypothetical protein